MSKAIPTWREAAKVLGLSEDTVWRQRKAKGDTFVPPFRDEDELWRWWRALKAPEPPKPARRKKDTGRAHVLDKPLDARKKVREWFGG